mmetsp:Transcript_47755/g.103950  ORF Transcript_47755/g.103950 Transcript_47755/m.103950 type:complete len:370 (+) Transcript_47755:57-1166(+)|eukprot:CAMPEP_0170603978 /NCGR_PEP_ID=MMETSP0224-20130122/19187_1 /TAXON_ID=285029 /ORGANISM="Togula jolla, Strain CCCM 725" /LENGTH=369 /DNA_ID=CAMNT_0010928869 /DNA_START=52 /DNA_END=1161 /DNA_ORIENTATION=-
MAHPWLLFALCGISTVSTTALRAADHPVVQRGVGEANRYRIPRGEASQTLRAIDAPIVDPPDKGTADCKVFADGGEVVGETFSFIDTADVRFNSHGAVRCYNIYTPEAHPDKLLPVVIFFHESHGYAAQACRHGGYPGLVDEGDKVGFAVICADANVHWDIPEMSGETGEACDRTKSADQRYLEDILQRVHARKNRFDSERIYLAGHSEGSMFTTWASFCYADQIRGFSTSGVGLKTHGKAVSLAHCGITNQLGEYNCQAEVDDGLLIPKDYGACQHCTYNPVKPWKAANVVGKDLDICLFSGCQDYFLPSMWSFEESLKEVKLNYTMHHFDGEHVIPNGYPTMLSTCFGMAEDYSFSSHLITKCMDAH